MTVKCIVKRREWTIWTWQRCPERDKMWLACLTRRHFVCSVVACGLWCRCTIMHYPSLRFASGVLQRVSLALQLVVIYSCVCPSWVVAEAWVGYIKHILISVFHFSWLDTDHTATLEHLVTRSSSDRAYTSQPYNHISDKEPHVVKYEFNEAT